MSENNILETALGSAETAAGVRQRPQTVSDGGVPFVLLPEGIKPEQVEAFMATPTRKRSVVAIREAASFIGYVKRFSDGDSLVFANIADLTITGVLDYHRAGDGSARWGQHRAQLTCQLTEDWKRWIGRDKKHVSQIEFAQFLEDNLPNIARPSGAEILEIAKTLLAKKAVNFSSGVRLDNGETQFTYEETIAGSAGQKGHLEIPNTFTLGIEPFEGAGLYEMDARLRYRIAEGGRLEMWFELVRPAAVIEDAFKRTRDSIASGVQPVLVLAAQPPSVS